MQVLWQTTIFQEQTIDSHTPKLTTLLQSNGYALQCVFGVRYFGEYDKENEEYQGMYRFQCSAGDFFKCISKRINSIWFRNILTTTHIAKATARPIPRPLNNVFNAKLAFSITRAIKSNPNRYDRVLRLECSVSVFFSFFDSLV